MITLFCFYVRVRQFSILNRLTLFQATCYEGYPGWSKIFCAPDHYNTESYKWCSKCPPLVSRHLLTRRTVFSKTVFSIARSIFRMCSVMAIFKSSIVWELFQYTEFFCTVIIRCTETFPENSVRNYHSLPRKTAEERRFVLAFFVIVSNWVSYFYLNHMWNKASWLSHLEEGRSL
jgi:hypothetical protein